MAALTESELRAMLGAFDGGAHLLDGHKPTHSRQEEP